jgi:hypothetical protein
MAARYARSLSFLTAIAAFTSPAMSTPARCHVVADEKLAAGSGGAGAICNAVEKAIAAAAPNAHYSAQVTVLSPSRLSASLIVDGRTLPEQKFAVMDRGLNPASIQRFAQALAAEVAKAAKP